MGVISSQHHNCCTATQGPTGGSCYQYPRSRGTLPNIPALSRLGLWVGSPDFQPFQHERHSDECRCIFLRGKYIGRAFGCPNQRQPHGRSTSSTGCDSCIKMGQILNCSESCVKTPRSTRPKWRAPGSEPRGPHQKPRREKVQMPDCSSTDSDPPPLCSPTDMHLRSRCWSS